MRKLNKKQIKLIEEHVKNHGIDNMEELIRACEKINDYEMLWRDVRRHAEDLNWLIKGNQTIYDYYTIDEV